MKNFNLPAFGGGAGLRHEQFDEILEGRPAFPWFEIISEDFMNVGGYTRERLRQIREIYPIIAHGVCMSIGSTDPLDMDYLRRLRSFLDEIKSPWTSDHLCFTMVDHTNLLDLIPLPFTQETVDHVVERVRIVQDILERPFLLENVTRYVTVSDREMSESEFICSIVERANCGVLLDVTNAHLNGKFHGYDSYEFIKSLPIQRIGQVHVAGWEPDTDGTVIDSHDAPVPPEVWQLVKFAVELIGPTSVLVERDASMPPVSQLLEEALQADTLVRGMMNEARLSAAA